MPLMICGKNQTYVDTTEIFSTANKFDTREEATRWIIDAEIRNIVIVIITRSDTKIGKRGRSDKVIFGCDRGGKYKEGDSETQSATKNMVFHSKLSQHHQKMVLVGRLT